MAEHPPVAEHPPAAEHPIERALERAMFASRWLLAPIHIGLIAGLVALLVKFVQKTFDLLSHLLTMGGNDVILSVLLMVDLALTAGLVLMVMFSGYENFVSRIYAREIADKPEWMGTIGFGDLKLKLMASIVAISAIHLLGSFMNIAELSDRELAWSVGIHMAFVVSAVLLAVMDRMTSRH